MTQPRDLRQPLPLPSPLLHARAHLKLSAPHSRAASMAMRGDPGPSSATRRGASSGRAVSASHSCGWPITREARQCADLGTGWKREDQKVFFMLQQEYECKFVVQLWCRAAAAGL